MLGHDLQCPTWTQLRIAGLHQVVDIVGFGNGTRCQKRRIGNNAVDKRLTLTVCEDYYSWNDWPELDDLDHSMAQWLRVGHTKDYHPCTLLVSVGTKWLSD